MSKKPLIYALITAVVVGLSAYIAPMLSNSPQQKAFDNLKDAVTTEVTHDVPAPDNRFKIGETGILTDNTTGCAYIQPAEKLSWELLPGSCLNK